LWIKRHSHSHSHSHSHRHRHTRERERERESKKRLGLHVRQGKIFEMCIKKTASKRKAGFSFDPEAVVLDICKSRKKLAN
jgi:hypothetical protein